jgi:lysozyme
MDKGLLLSELLRDECIDGKPALKPYRDSVGVLTIGIGHNLEKGITEPAAHFIWGDDVHEVMTDLDRAAKWWAGLDEVRQRVLANMCFNLGIDRLLKFRNMLGAIQLGLWKRAGDEMKSSIWYAQVGPRAARLEQAMRTGVMP